MGLIKNFILGAFVAGGLFAFGQARADAPELGPTTAQLAEVRIAANPVALELSSVAILKMWDFAGVGENGDAWIEGDTLRFLFGEFLDDPTNAMAPLVRELKGVRLTRDSEQLFIELQYQQDFTLRVHPRAEVPNFQLYAIRVPKTSRFSIQVKDGVLTVTQLSSGDASWALLVKLPLLPDRIYVHGTTLDLMTGEGTVTAGVLGDLLAIVARTQLKETNATFEGVSFWKSFVETLRWAQRAGEGAATGKAEAAGAGATEAAVTGAAVAAGTSGLN